MRIGLIEIHNWLACSSAAIVLLFSPTLWAAHELSYTGQDLENICREFVIARQSPDFEARVARPITNRELPLGAVRSVLIGSSAAGIGLLAKSAWDAAGAQTSVGSVAVIKNLTGLVNQELKFALLEAEAIGDPATRKTAGRLVEQATQLLMRQTEGSLAGRMGQLGQHVRRLSGNPRLAATLVRLNNALHLALIRDSQAEARKISVALVNRLVAAQAAKASATAVTSRGTATSLFSRIIRPGILGFGGALMGAGVLLITNPTPMGNAELKDMFLKHPESLFSVNPQWTCDLIKQDRTQELARIVDLTVRDWKWVRSEEKSITENSDGSRPIDRPPNLLVPKVNGLRQ